MTPTAGTDSGENERLWATTAAVVFAAVAGGVATGLVGADRVWPPFANSDSAMAVAGVLAAALVGWASWTGLARHLRTDRLRHGALSGLVTGVLAHPVMLFLWPLLPPADGLEWTAPIMPLVSVWSLLLVGWITVPAAVLAGSGVSLVRIVVAKRAERPVVDE